MVVEKVLLNISQFRQNLLLRTYPFPILTILPAPPPLSIAPPICQTTATQRAQRIRSFQPQPQNQRQTAAQQHPQGNLHHHQHRLHLNLLLLPGPPAPPHPHLHLIIMELDQILEQLLPPISHNQQRQQKKRKQRNIDKKLKIV